MYNILAVPYVNQYDITASLLSDFFTNKPDYTPYYFEFPSQEVFDWNKAMKKYNQPIDWRKIQQGPKMDNEEEQRSEHKKVSGVKYRTKKRKTYNFSQNFQIDITEVTSSEASETTRFQVEIELKPFRYMIDTVELNRVVLFVLQNLYGKSELF
jgi:hypothetical protein